LENSEIKVEEIDAVEQEFTTNSQTSENPSNEEQTKNIIVTPAQQDILKEITKIDIELEALEKTTVNEDEFYDKLDDILTPEEKYLQEDNPKEYLKVIFDKFDEKGTLVSESKEYNQRMKAASGIDSVSANKILTDNLLKTQKSQNIDAVAGATSNVSIFKKQVNFLFEKAKIGKTGNYVD
jgi:Flp pilus assembly protein CpaB